MISTHTPRAGSDLTYGALLRNMKISTHTPRAGSDFGAGTILKSQIISTPTPRAGSDQSPFLHGSRTRYFNPHSPCGE